MEQPPPERIDGGAFFRVIRRPGWQVVLVTKPGCGGCRAARAAMQRMGRRADEWLGEVDLEDAPGLAEEFDIFHLPAVLLFREGEWVGAVSAPLGKLREGIDGARAEGDG